MKKLDEMQEDIAEKIFDLLVGQTINSAKEILKAVNANLLQHAVIQEGGGDIE